MTDTDKIIAYIKSNHVLTLCSARGSTPWAANCFYAFDERSMSLFFLSDLSTRHGCELRDNPLVAGTVSSQQASVAKIRGLQFEGVALRLTGEDEARGRALYYRRFPIARLHPAPLWAAVPSYLKYTDNTLGFGRKLHWRRSA
ncbi:MAG: pyridoxamine 5'-phosphate oxidase family protein [Rhodospirillaceae bacterium]